jgi:hypothetical protein
MISSKHQVVLSLVNPAGHSYPLNKTRLIIGSGNNCDIKINDSSVSHYHALITLHPDEGVSIMDLESTNGTYINGITISKALLEIDDVLSLGPYQLHVGHSDEKLKIDDTEKNVEVIIKNHLATSLFVPLKEGLVLIDEEYCDIIFNEQTFSPSIDNPLKKTEYDIENFVDLDSWQPVYEILSKNTKNTKDDSNDKAIRITTLTNGNILETSYLRIQNKTYYASGVGGKGDIQVDLLDKKDLIPMLEIDKGLPLVHLLPNFEGPLQKSHLNNEKVVVMNHKTYQIFVELVDAPIDLVHISNFQKEKKFYQDAAKTFASILLPMLLLLLVDFSVPKPEKKLSIIYRKPMKSENSKKVASKSPTKTQKDNGHKKIEQPDKKLSFSKSGQKQKIQPRPMAKKISSSLKATKSITKAPSKTKAKVSAYQFKMNNMNSLFANSNKIKVKNSKAPSSVTTASSNNLRADLNTTIESNSSETMGRMGRDSRGIASSSFGTKGLTSMAGNDTAYIEPKTVVLGSMDPELLRKILQEYLPQFRHCYQQELVYNSEDIKGVVDLNFEIAGSGKVSQIDIKAKDTRFSKRGTNCMAKVLGIIDFPRPKGGGKVAVRQPLNFFSEKERG